MNLLQSVPGITFWFRNPKQVISDTWPDRNAILKSDVNLFCYRRMSNQQISTYLQKTIESDKEPITFLTDLNDLDKWISELRGIWDGDNKKAGDVFWGDFSRLVGDFLTFSQNKAGTIKLKMVHSDECSKFHTDDYSLRLFTTYYGKGTEWLPEKSSKRWALGKTNEQTVK